MTARGICKSRIHRHASVNRLVYPGDTSKIPFKRGIGLEKFGGTMTTNDAARIYDACKSMEGPIDDYRVRLAALQHLDTYGQVDLRLPAEDHKYIVIGEILTLWARRGEVVEVYVTHKADIVTVRRTSA
jgi:hypothetical protein